MNKQEMIEARAMKFRKKPVVIEAIRWDEKKATFELLKSMGMEPSAFISHEIEDYIRNLRISTLEGSITASYGDWIIKGVKGEFYPCKPDIFEMTYESTESHLPTPNRDELRAKINTFLSSFASRAEKAAFQMSYDEYCVLRNEFTDSILSLLPEYEEIVLPVEAIITSEDSRDLHIRKAAYNRYRSELLADIPKGSDGKLWRVKG